VRLFAFIVTLLAQESTEFRRNAILPARFSGYDEMKAPRRIDGLGNGA
jgi:hypothetical protein